LGLAIWKRALIKEKFNAWKEKRRERKYGKQKDASAAEDEEAEHVRQSVPQLELEDT
jgi:hypothetical protein